MGCPVDSDCIALKLDDDGSLDPTWLFAPDSNVSCGPAGLISPKLLSAVACAQVNDDTLTPPFGGVALQSSPVATITNPSGSRDMILQAAILFGTPQITVDTGGELTVVDSVGVGPTGSLLSGSYTPVNTSSWNWNDSYVSSATQAYNTYNATRWSCGVTIGAGQSFDVAFERRCTLAGQPGGTGSVLLRTTFLYLWGVVT